jgi:class 3 adenylate cyclase/tetratricopeptide (TPR) repeat protein
MRGQTQNRRFDRYVPRVLLRRLLTAPDEAVLTLEGTIVFVDISGFTRLSERLARKGREGAEYLADTIGSCFSELLAAAYMNGGSLLKFGGDALLIWFDGDEHALRACASAVAMRRTLRQIGRIRAGGGAIVLRMSVGVHTGSYDMFLVGSSHRELLIAGPAASEVVEMEAAASAGQILVSEPTAMLLPERCLGATCGPGVLLARSPSPREWMDESTVALPPDETVAGCLSTAVRAHLTSEPAAPEHRTATVSFLQFSDVDRLILGQGAAAAAEALDALVRLAQDAADRYDVCFLGSDIAAGGGKLLFSAGAPRAAGDDEERMLLAMRQVIDSAPPLPVRIGVNRGSTFTGEVGPAYRRTYTVMGDVVNLAARLMAKAPWGTVYATDGVLRCSRTKFAATAVPPFMVKGKLRPVDALAVGSALRAAPPGSSAKRLPLIGRERELAILSEAITATTAGRHGTLVELVGERGSGKSRLLAEALELAVGTRLIHATCESYTQAIPYIAWREPLRQLVGMSDDDGDALALQRLRAHVTSADPELLPWLPLLAIVIGAEAPATRAVEELAPEFRAAKLHEVVIKLIEPELAVPTLVLVEHAHLMDEASAGLLDALAGRLEHAAWVVIVTRRDTGAGFAASSRSAVRVELEPLAPDAMLKLAESTPEAHVIPPHVLRLAVDRSAGSPEFLLDLLAAAAGGSDALPDTVETAARARIDSLDPGDRNLIRRASVLGLTFRPHRLRALLEPGAEPGSGTWARLSGVFAYDGDGHVRFTRPALCEAAYDSLPFRLRRELHAVVGAALEADLGHDADADPAVLSLHFARAGDHDRAWRYALMGARGAAEHFAQAEAARLYRRALDAGRAHGASPTELAGAWEALGEALAQTGELGHATNAFASARRLQPDDAIAQARLCFRHARIAESSELSSAVRWTRRGLRTLEQVHGREARIWRARLVAELGWIRQRQRKYDETERLCREALREGHEIGELRAQARACYTLDWALFELGRPDEATYSSRALDIYRELGDPQDEGNVLNNLGGFAYWRGHWAEAIELYRQAGECRERAGNAAGAAETDANVGEILSDQGHLQDAEDHLRRALRVWSSTGHREGAAFANMLLGRLAVRAGDAEEGIAVLEATTAEMRRVGVGFYADLAHALVAEGEAVGGRPARAIEIAVGLLGSGSPHLALLHRAAGIAQWRLGDTRAARRELDLALDAARAGGEDYEVALALDALSALECLDGEQTAERDAILTRLGVVRLPPLAGPERRDTHERAGAYPGAPVTVFASR